MVEEILSDLLKRGREVLQLVHTVQVRRIDGQVSVRQPLCAQAHQGRFTHLWQPSTATTMALPPHRSPTSSSESSVVNAEDCSAAPSCRCQRSHRRHSAWCASPFPCQATNEPAKASVFYLTLRFQALLPFCPQARSFDHFSQHLFPPFRSVSAEKRCSWAGEKRVERAGYFSISEPGCPCWLGMG
jgi:hypothetical protein